MKTVIVAGGAGFIGSHMCEFLLDRGDEVICIDNLSTGTRANVDLLSKNGEHFTFMKLDLSKQLNLVDILKRDLHIHTIDEIYNFASPASPKIYNINPIKTTMTNINATISLLELAKHHKCKIFFASTCEIYGDPLISPQFEEYNGNVPLFSLRSSYFEGKRCAENLMHNYAYIHGVDIRVVRIFNTYGPRMPNDGRVINAFINAALSGAHIPIIGDGTHIRSFCYISDLINGINIIMNSNHQTPLNIGNENYITVIDLAHKIIRLSDSNSVIEFLPENISDPKQYIPDLTKARLLGYQPKIQLEEGLLKTIEYIRRGEI